MADERFPYHLEVERLDGSRTSLEAFKDQVLLVVNTASRCGFTPQYAGLEGLYRTYKDRGFSVLGFPCNQFLNEEPGSAEEIETFCRTRFDVTFPMFAKIDVNGPLSHPVYRYLKRARPGLLGSSSVKWNFTKFLVDAHGQVVSRHPPNEPPERLAPAIERLLAERD